MSTLYGPGLSAIHHEAFASHGDLCAPGILTALAPDCQVLELGAGSGALTRHLVAAGHRVIATDASTDMLDLLAEAVPHATVGRLVLGDDGIVPAPNIVSVGHVLNYLGSQEQVFDVLLQCVDSLEMGGLLLLDLLDRSYAETRATLEPLRWEGEGWEMDVTFALASPDRFVRDISLTWTDPDGTSHHEHEVHTNILVDADEACRVLVDAGLVAEVRRSFGDEVLPAGFAVLHGARPAG